MAHQLARAQRTLRGACLLLKPFGHSVGRRAAYSRASIGNHITPCPIPQPSEHNSKKQAQPQIQQIRLIGPATLISCSTINVVIRQQIDQDIEQRSRREERRHGEAKPPQPCREHEHQAANQHDKSEWKSARIQQPNGTVCRAPILAHDLVANLGVRQCRNCQDTDRSHDLSTDRATMCRARIHHGGTCSNHRTHRRPGAIWRAKAAKRLAWSADAKARLGTMTAASRANIRNTCSSVSTTRTIDAHGMASTMSPMFDATPRLSTTSLLSPSAIGWPAKKLRSYSGSKAKR